MVAMLGYSGQAVMTGVGPLKNLTDHVVNPSTLLDTCAAAVVSLSLTRSLRPDLNNPLFWCLGCLNRAASSVAMHDWTQGLKSGVLAAGANILTNFGSFGYRS